MHVQTKTSILLLSATMTACATYVNIPPQSGDVATHNPNLTTVRTVQEKALQAVLNATTSMRPVQVILPVGVTSETYKTISSKLDPQASWSEEEDTLPDHWPIRVSQVRVRGWLAQVDVARPTDPGQDTSPGQLVTVYLKWDPVTGWYVQRLRPWHMALDEAMERSRQAMQEILP